MRRPAKGLADHAAVPSGGAWTPRSGPLHAGLHARILVSRPRGERHRAGACWRRYKTVRWWGERENLLWARGGVAASTTHQHLLDQLAHNHAIEIFSSCPMDDFSAH